MAVTPDTHINTNEQPPPRDFGHAFILLGDLLHASPKHFPSVQGVFLKVLIFDNIETRQSGCRGDGISSKGIEITSTGTECFQMERLRRYESHWKAVAH